MPRWMTVLIVAVVVLALGGWIWRRGEKPAAGFRTAPVVRGDLLATISATGTLEPEEVVDVGAQVAGQINSLGKDPSGNGKLVDYNSEVENDLLLAEIDDSLYRADL